jgi:hypothetical protein
VAKTTTVGFLDAMASATVIRYISGSAFWALVMLDRSAPAASFGVFWAGGGGPTRGARVRPTTVAVTLAAPDQPGLLAVTSIFHGPEASKSV